MVESLSLIDAVMPDVVASRQNQINQQKQQVKTEVQDTNGEEGNFIYYNNFYNNISYNYQELFHYPGTPWSIKIFKFNRPPY